MAAAVVPPVTAEMVANAFVVQYYQILHHSPGLVYRFYQEISKLGRPEDNGSMSVTTTLQAINEKIMLLNYGDTPAVIKSVDAQDSHHGGVHVLVTGHLPGKLNPPRKFAQTFFLAPQDKGYFVLSDMFRFLEDANVNEVADVLVPVSDDSGLEEPVAEVHNPPQNEDDTTVDVEEETPVPEVVDEVQHDSQRDLESSSKAEEGPKKSYASIVMHLKQSGATFSPPPAARKYQQKIAEPVNPPAAQSADEPVMTLDSAGNENSQDGEADGYSIYVKGLPMSATDALLREVFKKFGPIKNDGIQVRSNRGFCFGFVEFEDAISVQKALEASPVSIDGRQAFVEEKRSTNHRGSNKGGRFPPSRNFGFRNDNMRGRGNYGGRGYNPSRSDFSGSRGGGSRGGPSNHRDGYQRTDNSRNGGGMSNGNSKNITPRVSATA